VTDYPFEIVLLEEQDRTGFCCGNEALDRYFRTQARQDMRRRVTACYVAIYAVTGRIAGYYTLSAEEVALSELPEKMLRRLPRYPSVPVARVGRLAVEREHQGRGLGGALLINAAMRAMRSEIAVFALVVDAKDAEAARFYQHYGF
jgi:GNAT superfamily N-acetyltransferase